MGIATLTNATLQVDLGIKFRAFGITFGTWAEHFKFPFLVALAADANLNVLTYDNHGVSLRITWADVAPLSEG